MSMSNFIPELLELKDPNIKFSNNVNNIKKKNITYNLIKAKLSYVPEHCPICGCLNENYSIIKYGTKPSDIKLLPCNGNPTILRLNKQRFFCKECGQSFLATSDIVEPNCYISKQVKLKILSYLSLKVSEKDIAFMTYVSHSTVSRAIDSNYTTFSPNYDCLPKHLMFDEFKSTKDAKGSMSFIFADCESHEIIDIVENRQLRFLKLYFSKYSIIAREHVETVCIDMYAPYMSIIKDIFPNAVIVIDRFHIVQLLTRAFNKTRVKAMSNFSTQSMEYKRLKRYWRLFLKSGTELNGTDFKHYTHFNNWISAQTLVKTSIAVDPMLETTYDVLQMLLYDIKAKNAVKLKNDLNVLLDKNISDYMKTSISSLLKYMEYVENSLKYEYSNGTIEGLNNYIKVIKRVAFGYRSFFHFRNRILISRNLIKPITKYQVA
ncbi:MAG TPA: ISL3 family transposase [Clostridia bacterium]|nr:ISL3 family transposase [Clostridia bacterium]